MWRLWPGRVLVESTGIEELYTPMETVLTLDLRVTCLLDRLNSHFETGVS